MHLLKKISFFICGVFIGLGVSTAADIEFERPNDYTLTAQLTDNLHFVCEKINPSKQLLSLDWKNYREQINSHVKQEKPHALSHGQKDALDTFNIMLKHPFCSNENHPGELWMAYLTDLSYENLQEIRYDQGIPLTHIEMSMSLGVVEPTVYSPVGILRNPLYEGQFHKNISLLFHGAAAMAMQEMYPEMTLLMTKPASSMRGILNKALQNVDSLLYLDQEKTHSVNHWAKETRVGNYRNAPKSLTVTYNGEILVQTDASTAHHYDFLVKEMSMIHYQLIAMEALQGLFQQEYQKIQTR